MTGHSGFLWMQDSILSSVWFVSLTGGGILFSSVLTNKSRVRYPTRFHCFLPKCRNDAHKIQTKRLRHCTTSRVKPRRVPSTFAVSIEEICRFKSRYCCHFRGNLSVVILLKMTPPFLIPSTKLWLAELFFQHQNYSSGWKNWTCGQQFRGLESV